MVVVDLNVWLPDGDLFDTTRFKSKPERFRLDLTIPAFAELIPKMRAGSAWRIWAPAEMTKLDDETYVDSPLVFDVELIRFLVRPPVPEHVSAPPREATRTITGLAYEILHPGTGTEHPAQGAEVEVNYAGWTRDGEMFDSSFDHGEPGRFRLDATKPPGWNEALRMMVVGEKRRIWIPEELAYAGQRDRPQGPLVFEVELLSFTNPD
jgi:peptidylprolyl isomerase